jgi:hypothetical protein
MDPGTMGLMIFRVQARTAEYTMEVELMTAA